MSLSLIFTYVIYNDYLIVTTQDYYPINWFIFSDIDECATSEHKCPSEARCMNDIGSYSCQCGYGYYGEERECKGMFSDVSLRIHCY